ncbi:hypothetical protein SLS62_008287 [Diatrype stigma]|uniref:Zn(2)-C6 fungal-type domain-containing protein n=1 Tax=Diatrype stigma TaxID=117547 RepID=A0AAN9UW57_9PEZI
MDLTVGSEPGVGEPGAEPIVPLPPATPQIGGRKKGTSCARCRRQKIRCDDNVPSCGNCIRTGQVCIRTHSSNNPDIISHINYTEARLRFLEDTLCRVAPEELAKAPPANKPGLDRIGTSYVNQIPTADQCRSRNEPHASFDRSDTDKGFQNGYSSHQRNPSSTSGDGIIASPTASSQIGPNEPLAHEVGLLSLANSRESKYLGPSSGVSFARLIFSSIPQSQGLATTWVSSGGVGRSRSGVPQAQPFPLNWTSDVDLQHFVDAYFETYHPLHPFLDEDIISEHLEIMYANTPSPTLLDPQEMSELCEFESSISPMYSVQIFLVIALGARALETRLSADFSSERYLATAQARIDNFGLSLHDTTEGLQVMLLLTLSSFYFENGPNAWFLNTALIASCLDLGFQRRWTDNSALRARMSVEEQKQVLHRKNIRSAIFWSTYSIERNLSVVLGRPLTLRDEAIDVEFPGEGGLSDVYNRASPHGQNRGSLGSAHAGSVDAGFKRPQLNSDDHQYTAAQLSFRLDQIVAEIKLMLHRVINLPSRFPWPTTDLSQWQRDTHARCDAILAEIHAHLGPTTTSRRRRRARTRTTTAAAAAVDPTTRNALELKYHHALMLLHRPSPALPRPSAASWRACHASATRTVALYADLLRVAKLGRSWLAAHAVFVSGITFVYCVWAQQIPGGREREAFARDVAACAAVLRFLGRTWTVAAEAVGKFERLARLTAASAWGPGVAAEGGGGGGGGGGTATPTSTGMGAAEGGVSATSPASDRVPLRGFQGYDATAQATSSTPNSNVHAAVPTDTDTDANQYTAAGDRNGGFDFEPMSFYTELGDTSAWFDLDWILSLNTGPSGEVISYPAP